MVIRVTEVLLVTKDDKWYELTDWLLVWGHKRQVRETKIIKELCYKQIISFTNDLFLVMALTSVGKVYSWSRKDWEVLGNVNKNYEIIKPIINEAIFNKSWAAFHSMVLTQNIELYVWGDNDFGQIGNGCEERLQ